MKTIKEIIVKSSFLHFMLMFGLVATMSSCGSGDKGTELDEGDIVAVDEDAAEEEWMEERNDFVHTYRETLTEADQELEQMEKNANNMTADAKAETQQEMEEIKMKRDKLEAELNTIESASEQEWEKTQKSLIDAGKDLEQSLKND